MKILPVIHEKPPVSQRQQYIDAVSAIWEKIPLEKLDPLVTAEGQLRVERTLDLIEKNIQVKGQAIIDIGCGTADIASKLAERGGLLTVVDVVKTRLTHIPYRQACLPYLPFADSSFDGIIFTDVIAEMEPALYRLALSELSRILKRDGWIVCSTQLDLYSHDARECFLHLLQTEFEVYAKKTSYHRLYFHLLKWINVGLRPLQNRFKKMRKFLLFAENLSEILWGSSGATHLIVLARKKKILYNI